MSEIVVKERAHGKSLRDLYYVFFRHKWKMILFFFAIIITVIVVTFLGAEVYRSNAKLLVRLGRESVTLDPTATTGQIINVSQTMQSQINSELQILGSQELVEKLVDSIGAETFLTYSDEDLSVGDKTRGTVRIIRQKVRNTVKGARNLLKRWDLVESVDDRDRVVLGIMQNLWVEAQKDSSVISISYKARSPKLAQQVVAEIIDLYLEKHIAVHQTPGSYQFFNQQSEQLRAKLTQSESELRNLKNEIGISSLQDRRRVVSDRVGVLEKEIDNTDAALTSSGAKVQALQKALTSVPETMVTQKTTGFPNYAGDAMREEIFKLQLEELKLLTNFTEQSRMAEAVHEEIVQAQELVDGEEATRTQVTQGLSLTHEQLQLALHTEQANLSLLQAKAEAQKRQLANAQKELKNLNEAEVRINKLKREISTQELNYRKYSENLEQARIDHALEGERISNISVVQPATLPVKPIRPRKLLNLALGFFLGILGAIVLAIFSEYLDHSLKTPEEAEEKLQLPTLVSIPRVRGVRAMRVFPTAKWRRKSKAGGKVSEKVPAKVDIHAKIREPYEAFRERLLLCPNGSTEPPYILAVVGYHRHEGVSTVATNLATTLSMHGDSRVLLVDANIQHPLVHRIFKAKLSPGLTDVLSNGQSVVNTVQSLPAQNLYILSAGATNGNLSEIFDSDGFTKMLNSMKNYYRYVVIDVPALSEASSAARLASLCDGVVLVVEAERLRWEVAQRAREQLLNLEANVLGVALNKRRFYIPGWLYRTL
jgi:capsular exopolysaccharide synthesis family protein